MKPWDLAHGTETVGLLEDLGQAVWDCLLHPPAFIEIKPESAAPQPVTPTAEGREGQGHRGGPCPQDPESVREEVHTGWSHALDDKPRDLTSGQVASRWHPPLRPGMKAMPRQAPPPSQSKRVRDAAVKYLYKPCCLPNELIKLDCNHSEV
ncbi:hypothetical protein Anapl_09965 [Anas platyrhynchos]|uniref:Uncharacterized protein n=1 Tax=Anas platyrhynchos TaxID=8839 RepID=R0L8L2_ANAPL|nr:hypothetical protein Anapl_09965 [Anas platyrhynchos]